MSKTRDTGFLGNVVKYDANGNINLVNGATTLLSVSSSGQLTVPGDEVITGSLTVLGGITGAITGSATSASYAANTSFLNGSGSGEFVPTGSFNTFSSSILSYTGSVNSQLSALQTTSGSNITRLSALESASGSAITRLSALEVTSGSNITRLSSLEARTGSYATTGSNIFVGNQTITGSVLQSGSLSVNGCIVSTGAIVAQTINVQQVTSSVVYSCGSNIFGTALNNTQTICGNIFATGSVACFAGTVCAPTFISTGTVCSSGNTCFGGMSVVASCLGIGTATPAAILHVSQPSANTVFRLGNNTTYDQFIYFNGNSDWSLGMDYSNSNALAFSNSSTLGTNDRMVITTGGAVGIGTTTPNALLHVSSVDFDDTYVKIEQRRGGYASSLNLIGATDDGAKYNRIMSQTCGGTNHWQIGGGGVASTMVFLTGNCERMRITSGGDAYIRNTTAAGVNSQSLPGALYLEGYGWNTSAGSENIQGRINLAGAYDSSSGSTEPALVFSLKGSGGGNVVPAGPSTLTERMRITNAGYVGIGTNCPQEKLTIDGTSCGAFIRINNASAGDITSGFRIYNGNNLDTEIYTNPTFGNTTFLTRENLAIRAGGSQRLLISCTGISCFACQVCAPLFKGGNFSTTTCTFAATTPGTNYDVTIPGYSKWLVSVYTAAVYHWNGILALTTFDSADFDVKILTCGAYQTAAQVGVVGGGTQLRFCFSQNVGNVTLNYTNIG